MTIWFDMDGTLADLYGVNGWLEMLTAHDETPYAEAKPLVNMQALARMLNNRQRKGYHIAIVTALAKNTTAEYDERVIHAKAEWLKKHLATVKFDKVVYVPYDFTKDAVNRGNDVLFDDEARHLEAWRGKAYHAKEMMKTLKEVLR